MNFFGDYAEYCVYVCEVYLSMVDPFAVRCCG